MKEDLICGVAILLYLVLLYLLMTAFIKTGRAVERYDKIKVGQRYEHKSYFEDPFERGKHVIKILDIKEGYALYEYEYEEKLYIRSSVSLEDIAKIYVLITDIK